MRRRTTILLLVLTLAPLLPVSRASAGIIDLTVDGLEVNQGIQYFRNRVDPDNGLPLIRGRRTTVRMYVDVSGTDLPVAGVDGRLRVFINGVELSSSPLLAENGPITAPLTVDREETHHTLNFEFEIPGTGISTGAVDVDLIGEVDPANTIPESSEANNALQLNDLSFECRRSPSITYVPVDYFDTMPSSFRMAPGVGDDFIWHAFPIPDPPNYFRAPGPPLDFDQDINANDGDLINDLELLAAGMVPVPDFINGWLPENPYGGNGLSNPGGRAVFSNTQASPNRWQRTFAHEIGHMFGLAHNGRDLDPDVGFDGGFPFAEVTTTDDCDPAGTQGTKCRELNDVMVAGLLTPNAWVDSVTYDAIAGDPLIQAECPRRFGPFTPFRPLEPLAWELVPFNIPNCEVIDCGPCQPGPPCGFEAIWNLSGPVELTPRAPEGNTTVQFFDAQGQLLFEATVDVEFEVADSPEPLARVPVVLRLPRIRGAQLIVLRSQGFVLQELERSPSRPRVTLLAPEGGIVRPGVTIRWRASDADRDVLRFLLTYSPDGGKSWIPLGVDLTSRRFTVPRSARIPSGDDGQGVLRLVATDGLNGATREVGGLSGPAGRRPEVRIVEPESEKEIRVRRGAGLTLQGYGYDVDDGFLPDSALRWFSDRAGELGRGRLLQVNRLRGLHVIRLVGRDSDGNARVDEVTVRFGR